MLSVGDFSHPLPPIVKTLELSYDYNMGSCFPGAGAWGTVNPKSKNPKPPNPKPQTLNPNPKLESPYYMGPMAFGSGLPRR